MTKKSKTGLNPMALESLILNFVKNQKATDCDANCEMCRDLSHDEHFAKKLAAEIMAEGNLS